MLVASICTDATHAVGHGAASGSSGLGSGAAAAAGGAAVAGAAAAVSSGATATAREATAAADDAGSAVAGGLSGDPVGDSVAAAREAEERARREAAEAKARADEEAARRAAAPAPEAAAPEAPSVAAGDVDYDGDGVIEGTNEGTRPEALTEARGGKADDLKQIKGIGPKMEKLCNSLGFYHFDQIASWSADEVAWVDANLEGFKGRVSRDTWVDQAKLLAAGGETEFSKKVNKGGVYD